MPIDYSMYSQMQVPDVVGGIERGMRMRDLADERKKKSALDAAYKAGVVQNPDGTSSFDQGRTMNELMKGGFVREAEDIKRQQASDAAAAQKQQYEKAQMAYNLASSAVDQPSWTQARGEAVRLGLAKENDLPEQYDPGFVKSRGMMALNAMDRLGHQFKVDEATRDQNNKDRDFGLRESEIKAKGQKESAGLAADLRKERSGLPTTKATADVSAAFNRIQSAAKNPSPAGDLSLIFNYMKMLDPGSTVREGEFANAQNAAGIPTQVVNMYNRAIKGERLAPEQRADFIGQAGGLYKSQLDIQKQVDSQFSGYAKNKGIDPNEVLLNFEANQPQQGNQVAGKVRGSSGSWGIDSANAGVQPKVFKTKEIEWAD